MRPSFIQTSRENTEKKLEASTSKRNINTTNQPQKGSLDEYGDDCSTYWPPGWNFARWRRSTATEILLIPTDELVKTQAGLHEVLGEAGTDRLGELIAQESLQKKQAEQDDDGKPAKGAAELQPRWLTAYNRRCKGRSWGFFVIKAFQGDEDDTWSKFKSKIEEISRLPFALERTHNIDEASSHWKLEWLEAEEDSDNQVNLEMKKLQTTFTNHVSAESENNGISRKLFLVATQEVVSQVLKQATPDTEAKRWRADAPFVLASPATGDSAMVFKVALETLADELWFVLEGMDNTVAEISANVQSVSLVADDESAKDDNNGLEDVWWSTMPSPSRLRKRRRIA